MSLVGSEVSVDMSQKDAGSPTGLQVDTSGLSSGVSSHCRHAPEDIHPTPSPKRPSEHLFLGEDLDTQKISAADFAEQINSVYNRSSTVATDDFMTAQVSLGSNTLEADDSDNEDDRLTYIATIPTYSNTTDSPLLGLKDAFFSNATFSNNGTTDPEKFHDTSMTMDAHHPSPVHHATHPATHKPSSSSSTKKDLKLENPAEVTYDKVKGVWTWGKGVRIFSPFLGLAEAVAGKVLHVAGSSLEELDGGVSDNLHTVDDKYLNPALSMLLSAVHRVYSKGEDILKPMLRAILKPVGLMKDKAENPELTTSHKSGVTTIRSN
jgi:hypothetical protein